MRRTLSIRQRVTFFYASVMALLALVVMLVLYVTLDLQMLHVSHASLEKAVKDSFDYIDAPGDWLEISDQFDFYVHDVTVLVYGSEGTIMLGHAPSDFPDQLPLRSDIHQTISTEYEEWQVYDLYNEYPNGAGIWIRGIHSLSSSRQTLQQMLRSMLIIMPILILTAILLGNLVTRRAFAPIERIQKTAASIHQDRDLSRRINLAGKKQDELVLLASTFDKMFDRLEKAFTGEKQFTSDVSHELRTPISVIISQAEYGLSEQHDADTYRECLSSILDKSKQMSELVSQLLELSRAANIADKLNKEPINLAELCEVVSDELAPLAEEKQIRFIHKLDKGICLPVDQTQMLRAVLNLVSNAISYGKENGFVMLDLHREKDQVMLIISDDGEGIEAHDLDNIFNRFFQANRARTKNKSSNTGLGLTMVKQIIEAHGGTISVQSTKGVGSAFTITLPDTPCV